LIDITARQEERKTLSMPRRLTTVLTLGLALAVLPASLAGKQSPSVSLAGHWRLDAARSTDLSPWSTLELTIAIDGDEVTVQRRFGAGRRTFTEEIRLDLTREVNLVSVPWWPDNRHLGAYAGGDRTKCIRASFLDRRRLLRLSSDLVLETQQGPREINILSDYKVSLDGARLTLTELRSTRQRPVVYVFSRVTDR
jgi:hypothetical protein